MAGSRGGFYIKGVKLNITDIYVLVKRNFIEPNKTWFMP